MTRLLHIATLLTAGCLSLPLDATAGKTVYVDKAQGSNGPNCGAAPDSGACRTLNVGSSKLVAGDVMIIAPGTYYETPSFVVPGNAADDPTWIRADVPGTVTISGAWEAAATASQTSTVIWTQLTPDPNEWVATWHDTLFAAVDGSFLFRANTVEDLRAAHTNSAIPGTDLDIPPVGYAMNGDTIHLRLDPGANPNDMDILFSTPATGADRILGVVRMWGSPNLIFDGLRIEGSGSSCMYFDAGSPHATLRNMTFSYCATGAKISHDSLIEWSEYTYPGFKQLADFGREHHPELKDYVFDLVKEYHPSNWYEGAIADSQGQPSNPPVASTGCEFKHNYMHETFDGEALGNFESSQSWGSVYLWNFDNNIQMEPWAPGMTGADLWLHDSLFLSAQRGAISHADFPGLEGPQYVFRNVIYYLDEYGLDSWTAIKSDDVPPLEGAERIHYWHNTIWGGEYSLYYRPDEIEFLNNIFIFDDMENYATDPVNGDYNFLVNLTGDRPNARGLKGMYHPDVRWEDVGFVDPCVLDFGILPGSPAENEGVVIPEIGNSTWGVGRPDMGAFQVGEWSGYDWPRPAHAWYECADPERWVPLLGAPARIDCDTANVLVEPDGFPVCTPEDCGDGIDNDLNGLIDCEDPDCASDPSCAP